MSNEPITGQPYQQEGSKQTDAVQNSTLNYFSAWVNCWVLSIGATTPPGSPANGDRHIVGTAATGAWATHDDQLAVYRDGWQFYAPPASGAVTIYNMDDHSEWRYDAGWATAPAGGDVQGPASSVDLRIAVFDGLTGKSLKDGGKTIAELATHPVNAQTGTSYAILAADRGKRLTLSNAASIAATIAAAGTTGFEDGFFVFFEVTGDGAVTITPTTSTINGAATLVLNSGMSGILFSDGTNYRVMLLDQSGITVNPQTGTSYTYLSGDRGKLVSHINGAAIAGTLPQATGAFGARWFTYVQNRGVGTLTITPTTSTIDGSASLALTTGQGVLIASDGTNYYTMRGMVTGGGGGGGLTNFTEGVNTSTPNATIPVVSITPNNAATNVDVAIVPKGSRGFALAIADNLVTGGNKRGHYSIDLQLNRAANTQVASGNLSALVGGGNNTASNSSSGVFCGVSSTASGVQSAVLGGQGATASGQYAAVVGGTGGTASATASTTLGGINCIASGHYSVAMGTQAISRSVENMLAHGVALNKQITTLPLYIQTTSATPGVLASNNSAAATTNQYTLPTDRMGYFLLKISARQSAGAGGTIGDCAGWLYLVLLKNIGGTVSIVGTPTLLGSHADTGAALWTGVPTANNTLKCLTATGTGEVNKTIQWSAAVTAIES